MGRKRKVGRPKGSKSSKRDTIVGCSKVKIYRMRKGRIQEVVGYKHRACID